MQAADLVDRPERAWVPEWPVIAPGLFVSYVGDCYLALIGAQLDGDGFDALVRETGRAIVGSPKTLRVGSIVHANAGPWWSSLSLGEKTARLRQYSAMSTPHDEHLRLTVPASAAVMVSTVARTAVRTLFLFAPSPNPVHVSKTAAEGYSLMARAIPAMQPALQVEAHRLAAERYAPDLLPTVGKLR